MPYRSILGGSPLGLINVRSAPSASGYASFNIDKSRNVKVAQYNKSRAGSLFTGKKNIRAWPNMQATTGGEVQELDENGKPLADSKVYPDVTGTGAPIKDQEKNYRQSSLHGDSIYDTSILNIIEKLAGTKAGLRPSDFAYLKNVGVYPNNRLIICRRFLAPSADNIMVKGKTPEWGSIATLISWVPESEDFLKLSFGEEWIEAEADFKGVLNSLGEDLGIANLGGIGGAAGNVTPLPGFTEIFQRAFLAKLGLLENSAANMIPAGNPNLIKQAKARKTVGYSEAGSGLSCTCNISIKCEYELKYISGIDPTIVWMDIIAGIVRFGTSNSEGYGLSKGTAAKLIGWANNPAKLINDVVSSLKGAVNKIKTEVSKKIKEIFNAATDAAAKEKEAEGQSGDEDPYAGAKQERNLAEQLLEKIGDLITNVSSALIKKYRVKIIGIVNALAGLPSTPWHITIGNPLRPIFCSGDMLTKSVSMTLGPQLAFNDLPSSITAEFNLENARPWGMQEIMAKFNSGYLRSVDVQKTYYETGTIKKEGKQEESEPTGLMMGEDAPVKEDPPPGSTQSAQSGGTQSGVNTNTTSNGQNPQSSGAGTSGQTFGPPTQEQANNANNTPFSVVTAGTGQPETTQTTDNKSFSVQQPQNITIDPAQSGPVTTELKIPGQEIEISPSPWTSTIV